MQYEICSRRGIRVRRASSLMAHLLVGFALLLMAPGLFGQGVSGRILGTVQDKSGAVVAKATVTVTNQGTGISTTIKT